MEGRVQGVSRGLPAAAQGRGGGGSEPRGRVHGSPAAGPSSRPVCALRSLSSPVVQATPGPLSPREAPTGGWSRLTGVCPPKETCLTRLKLPRPHQPDCSPQGIKPQNVNLRVKQKERERHCLRELKQNKTKQKNRKVLRQQGEDCLSPSVLTGRLRSPHRPSPSPHQPSLISSPAVSRLLTGPLRVLSGHVLTGRLCLLTGYLHVLTGRLLTSRLCVLTSCLLPPHRPCPCPHRPV